MFPELANWPPKSINGKINTGPVPTAISSFSNKLEIKTPKEPAVNVINKRAK